MEDIVDIRKISRLPQYSRVNVCAQIESVGEINCYPSGTKRRYVKLVDQNNSTINFVLWDNDTSGIDTNFEGKILYVQQALVNYFEQNVEIKPGRDTTIYFW